MELIDKKKFASASLDRENNTFVIYVTPFSINIYVSQEVLIAFIKMGEVIVFIKSLNFADIFSFDSAAKLLEYIGINDYFINLIKGQQPPYGPIYSLGQMKLEILKTYIKTNLTNGFIRSAKLLAGVLILFICKKNGSFWLYVNYQRLNNLSIKNCYLLLLIGKLLNQLSQTKQFT